MPRITGVDKSGHPVGAVFTAAHNTTVAGTLVCNGNAVSRTTYALLFAKIGTTHGSGDGSTTFNLPDYRGRFLRGWANGSANDPDRASRTASNAGGATGDNVGSVQGNGFGTHSHGGATGSHTHPISDPGHRHFVVTNSPVIGTTALTASNQIAWTRDTTDVYSYGMDGGGHANDANVGRSSSTGTGITQANGNTASINADGGNETRPINANVNYLIAYL